MKLNRMLATAGVATLLCLGTHQVAAQEDGGGEQRGQRGQGRGNFDPAQWQQQRLERMRERLAITDDAEWKALQPLVQGVMDAQTAVMSDRVRGMIGGRAGRGGGGPGGPGGRGGFGTPSPEADALQKAVDANAPAADVKAALAKLREARKEREAKLAQSQEELRKVLSVKQEAQAVLAGLID